MTLDYLRSVLDYSPETGVFVWKVALMTAMPAGSVAGTIYKNRRRYIAINKKRYFASRLAWFYVHGVWPTGQIDHRNGKRDDNRIDNLREATSQQNAANRGALRNNALGVKGVQRRGDGRFRARIRVNDRLINLGQFTTAEAASAAYSEAATRYFGEFARAV